MSKKQQQPAKEMKSKVDNKATLSNPKATENSKAELARQLHGVPRRSGTFTLQMKYWVQKGEEAFKRKDFNAAYIWYKKGADAGNVDCAFNVFTILNNYHQQVTIEKNKKEVLDHVLSICILAEVPEALHEQGNLYYEGRWGYEKNPQMASRFFTLGSNKDHLPSIFFTAVYLIESSKPERMAKGFAILNKLVNELQYLEAFVSLGNCHYLGRGTDIDHKKAFEMYESAQKRGCVQAQWRMANCYLKGEGVAQDPQKALKLFVAAADKGSSEALLLLAEIYEKGLFGNTSDLKKYFECVSRAEALGNHFGKCKVGISYLFGIGVVANRKIGFAKIEEVAKTEEDGFALYMLGICHQTGMGTPKNKKNNQIAFEYYQKSAAKHCESGIRALAIVYKNGEGVAQDPKKAFELIQQLANKGSLEDKTLLASYYMEGIGVPKDYVKAATLTQEVLDHPEGKNQADALITMSLLSLNGWGVEKDPKRSIELLEQAAQKNSILANLALAERYREGTGVAKDHKRSFEYLKIAYDMFVKRPLNETLNLKHIHTIVGDYYLQGIGTERDYDKAVIYYGKSVANNHPIASDALGMCTLLGWGVDSNPEKAFLLFEQAYKSGNINAQNNLGWCYLYGFGTTQDVKRAYEYFVAAAEKGAKHAENNIAWCLLTGVGVQQDVERALTLFSVNSLQSSLGLSYRSHVAMLFKADEEPLKLALRQYYFASCQINGWGMLTDPKSGFEGLQEPAKLLVEARIMIAECYMYGLGVEKDEARGFKLLQTSAESMVFAKTRLAKAHILGIGIEKDLKRAIELLEEGAKVECPEALEKLALVYENGLGVSQDFERAIKLYEHAARRGSLSAQIYLGQRYQYGHPGLCYDIKKSVEFLEMAALRGQVLARQELAECYAEGKGVLKNIAKAVEIYRSLADQHNALAETNLGLLLEDGWENCPPSREAAVRLYELSAEHGEPLGTLNLARCYQEGIGVAQDLTQAATLQRAGEEARRNFLPMKTRAFKTSETLKSHVGLTSISAVVDSEIALVGSDSRRQITSTL